MNAARGKCRLACILVLAVAFAIALPDANRARARGGAGLDGGAGLALIAITIGALVIGGAIALALEASGERRPADPVPVEPAGEGAATPSPDRITEAARRAFLALPRCEDVGGYEAYRKRTGELCRLY